ncbi:hypothetical protein [Mangrovimonas sp. TPBH4]|uniref:hypothetical protein n=1 Tax=Mangrovimonas sp. TPBH4 TaxID=1645914 RepID=UPI0006B59B84|nr:hypothetical protein [Mangrovimonas sp. TPBH4]
MEKTFLFTYLTLLLTSLSYSQKNTNEFQIYYGLVDTELLNTKGLDGTGGIDLSNSFEFGVKYLRYLSDNFSIGTGINYQYSKVTIRSNYNGIHTIYGNEDLKIISIPFHANYMFWNFVFINAGPILDIQTSSNSVDSQSGIGYAIGFGGIYRFNQISIFINPNFKRHAFIPFNKESYHRKLTELGLQLGIGYTF